VLISSCRPSPSDVGGGIPGELNPHVSEDDLVHYSPDSPSMSWLDGKLRSYTNNVSWRIRSWSLRRFLSFHCCLCKLISLYNGACSKRESRGSMDAGTWISLGAAVVSVGGASIASWQGVLSRRSAIAARDQAVATREQADAAKKSLAIQQAQYDQQERDRVVKEAAQARLVVISIDGPGTLKITVTNSSSQPVTDVSLEGVQAEIYPDWQWSINRNVLPPVSTELCVLGQRESHTFPVWFTDEDGQIHRVPSGGYNVTIAFTDAANRRWRRMIGKEPIRIMG
jgi:hypothetical protein